MYVGHVQTGSDVEPMANTANYHLGLKGSLTFGSKQVWNDEREVVHDEVERTRGVQALVFVNVRYDSLKGCVCGEDQEKKCAQLQGLYRRVREHAFIFY